MNKFKYKPLILLPLLIIGACKIAPERDATSASFEPGKPIPRPLGYTGIGKGTASEVKELPSTKKNVSAGKSENFVPAAGLAGVLNAEFVVGPIVKDLNWGVLAQVLIKSPDDVSCLPEPELVTALNQYQTSGMDKETVSTLAFPVEKMPGNHKTSLDYINSQHQSIFYSISWILDRQDAVNPNKWSLRGSFYDNQEADDSTDGATKVELDPGKSFIEFKPDGSISAFSMEYSRDGITYNGFPQKMAGITFFNSNTSETGYILTRQDSDTKQDILYKKNIAISIVADGDSSIMIEAYDLKSPKARLAALNCYFGLGGKMGGGLEKWSYTKAGTASPKNPATTQVKPGKPEQEVKPAPTTTAKIEVLKTTPVNVPPPTSNTESPAGNPPAETPHVSEKTKEVQKPTQTVSSGEKVEDFNLPIGSLENLNLNESQEIPAPTFALINLTEREKTKVAKYIADNDKKKPEKRELLKEHGYRFDVATNITVTKSEILNKCANATALIKPTIFKVRLTTPTEYISNSDEDEESTTTMIGKVKRRFSETMPIFPLIKESLKKLSKQPKVNYFELAGCYDKNPDKTLLFFHNNIDQSVPSDDQAKWYPFSKAHSKLVYLGKRKIAFRALFSYVMPNSELEPIIGSVFSTFIENPAKWPRMSITWGGELKLDKSLAELTDLPKTASIRSSKRIDVSVHVNTDIKTDWYPDTGEQITIKNRERTEYIVVPNQNMMSFVGPMDVLKFEFAPVGS